MKGIILKKENGEVTVHLANDLLISWLKGLKNPCRICKNCSPLTCQKVEDGEKKDIRRYDFITEGYQLNNEKGGLESLVVSKCINYIEQVAKTDEMSPIEKKRILESIKICFFDAIDIDEADEKQASLFKRGLLVPYNPNSKK